LENTYYRQIHSGSIRAVAWSPAEPRILSTDEDGVYQVWDALSGQHVVTYSCGTNEFFPPAPVWSPDGGRIAALCADGTIRVWAAATGYTLQKHLGCATCVEEFAWSPNGRYIASGGDDDVVEVWRPAFA
jgi:WD40 repeat protein